MNFEAEEVLAIYKKVLKLKLHNLYVNVYINNYTLYSKQAQHLYEALCKKGANTYWDENDPNKHPFVYLCDLHSNISGRLTAMSHNLALKKKMLLPELYKKQRNFYLSLSNGIWWNFFFDKLFLHSNAMHFFLL